MSLKQMYYCREGCISSSRGIDSCRFISREDDIHVRKCRLLPTMHILLDKVLYCTYRNIYIILFEYSANSVPAEILHHLNTEGVEVILYLVDGVQCLKQVSVHHRRCRCYIRHLKIYRNEMRDKMTEVS